MGVAQSQTRQQDRQWTFFSNEQAAWIEAAVDRLIPGEPEWPGARDTDVAIYIDRQLSGAFGMGERLFLGGPIKQGTPEQGYQLGYTPVEVYRRALGSLLANASTPFASASDADKDKLLEQLETSNVNLDGVPSPVFFETLLANTIEGYFADPFYGGNKDMASWRMIGFPGAHPAYLGIYTRHGMHFDAPPVSMAAMRGAPHDHAQGHGEAQDAGSSHRSMRR